MVDPTKFYPLTYPSDTVFWPLSQLKISNLSNTSLVISYDGVTNHDFIVNGTTLDYYFQPNSMFMNGIACLPQNTVIYVKGTAGAGVVICSGLTSYSA
jgi:hypothetical protein